MPDIKLSLDGGFSLQNGDFSVTDGTEQLVLDINKVIRQWVGNYNIMKYAGRRNTRETANQIKVELEKALKAYFIGLNIRIVPVSLDSILIIIYLPNNQVIHSTIFNYDNGIIKYISGDEGETIYRSATNIYL